MAKNETTKSKAELYREERKARIAKAAAKNSKNVAAQKKLKKTLLSAVAIVVAAAIVLGIGYSVLISVSGNFTALEVGGTKVSVAEYGYFYATTYGNMLNQIQQYSSYGLDTSSFGFDPDLSPDVQYTTDAEGNEITWSDYFKTSTDDSIEYIYSYYNAAVESGLELTDDQKAEIEETIESIREEANGYGYSLEAYIKASYGNKFNEKALRRVLEVQTLVQALSNNKKAEIEDAITDDELKAEYTENKKEYDRVDVRYYKIAIKQVTAKDGETDAELKARKEEAKKTAVADAKAILEKITDEESFIAAVKEYNEAEKDTTVEGTFSKHSDLKTAIGEKAADWAFAAKENDKTVIEEENAVAVMYCLTPSYAPTSVTVRHSLVAFEEEDASTLTDKQKEEYHKKASKLLADLGEDFTEDDFAKMAEKNTDDTASAKDGGLYDDVRLGGNYVETFTEWSCDPARKPGDTGIVETDYGYHIMYFVKENEDDNDWKVDAKTKLANADFEKFETEILPAEDENVIVEKKFLFLTWTDVAVDDYCKLIKKNLAYSAQQG